MKNPFFRITIQRAIAILGNRGRLIYLVIQLATKMKTTDMSQGFWKERLFLMGRMLKAFATRRYKQVPLKTQLLLTAAIIYFLNPLDLIPDAIIVFGLTDDLAILTGVTELISHELAKFKKWEELSSAVIIN